MVCDKKINIFFHVATMGNYTEIFDEIVNCIKRSGLLNIANINIGKAGNEYIDTKFNISQIKSLEYGEFGTLELLQNFCKENDTKVLYIHTKGVATSGPHKSAIDDWRQYMMYFLVEQYHDCIEHLDAYDVCGVDWRNAPAPHFSGNFWWSKSSYINTLPKIKDISHPKAKTILTLRHNAEFWIGMNKAVKAKSMHDCGIDVYQRHLHRYTREKYKVK